MTTGAPNTLDCEHVFGPVPSRRLGLSLGVDLVPRKVCSLDCVYCEVGRTTEKTVQAKEWVLVSEVIEELEQWFSAGNRADYITFSGYGEPTLNSGLPRVIDYLKKRTKTPLALLTNGTLFQRPDIRRAVLDLDVILPSLDAADQATFRRVNRPHQDLDIAAIIDGMVELRKEFKGQIWLEVLLVHGMNDSRKSIETVAKAAGRIRPDKVQLNTVVRPGTERWAMQASETAVAEALAAFRRVGLKAEVVADFVIGGGNVSTRQVDSKELGQRILEVVERRPETVENLAASLGVTVPDVEKAVRYLLGSKLAEEIVESGKVFVKASS